MIKFKKTFSALYLLVFIIYALAPIVASLPQDKDGLRGVSGEDAPTARLMIAAVFDCGGAGQGTALSRTSDSDDADVLLKKKRTIFSTKILLDVLFGASPVIETPLVDCQILAADATRPTYYSALHYFVSGVSPPSLS